MANSKNNQSIASEFQRLQKQIEKMRDVILRYVDPKIANPQQEIIEASPDFLKPGDAVVIKFNCFVGTDGVSEKGINVVFLDALGTCYNMTVERDSYL